MQYKTSLHYKIFYPAGSDRKKEMKKLQKDNTYDESEIRS